MKLIATLDETDDKIIAMLCEGMAPKEIAHKLWKPKGYVHQRLHSLRKHFKCNTTIQLLAKLCTKTLTA